MRRVVLFAGGCVMVAATYGFLVLVAIAADAAHEDDL